jgi:hypothetical protein
MGRGEKKFREFRLREMKKRLCKQQIINFQPIINDVNDSSGRFFYDFNF